MSLLHTLSLFVASTQQFITNNGIMSQIDHQPMCGLWISIHHDALTAALRSAVNNRHLDI